MTREETISMLERLRFPEPWEPKLSKGAEEALDIALSVLSSDGEYIKKKDALGCFTWQNTKEDAWFAIKDLPTYSFSNSSENKRDLISRQTVINAIANTCFWLSGDDWNELIECINSIPSAENKGEWIPIVTRPMTEEEKEEYHGEYDPNEILIYDCPIPEDGQEVLVNTRFGDVTTDTFYRDDGYYFETYCDEGDVIAWQPKPEPYKKGE